MSKYLNLEDVALQRGENIFKVARLLTKYECKLFLHFGEENELLLCITDKMIEGNHHLFQVKKGTYPMTLNSQHECVQRLSNSNYGLSGLSFLVGKDEIRLKSVDDEDRSVCVVVHPDDVAKLPPLPKIVEGAPVTGELPYAKKYFENFVNYEKDVDERFESGKRKPHTVFITNEIKVNQNRGDTWKKFIQLANDSVGKKQVMIPGYGKIYLRRVRLNPEKEILYSHEQFDHDKSKKMPIGVFLIKRTAFDKAWTKIAQQ
jgi:hypothetical protein|tara:strand:+ start:153 stop:932 length:780 start_codon:yes stop_codon:yes gene_type:complete